MGVTPWQAGQRITAARLNQITPRWSAWTPTWTTSTGANTPSYGNASISGAYCQTGDVVFFRLEVTFGTTTSFGGGGTSDNWQFSLPVTASTTALIVGGGEAQDSATGGTPSGNRIPLRCRLTSTTALELETSGGATGFAGGYAATATGLIDAATPFTWASTDSIRVFGHYQAA
jgi:hypothetical protein